MIRFVNVVSYALVTWAVFALIPLSWFWYEVESILVADTPEGVPAPIAAERRVIRPVVMHYNVIVRSIPQLEIMCEAGSNEFTYQVTAENIKNVDMAWWAPQDPRCLSLPPGEYIMETCWTSTQRFWGIVPDQTVCIDSNVFHVTPN